MRFGDRIDNIADELQTIRTDINNALISKGVSAASSLDEVADLILQIGETEETE